MRCYNDNQNEDDNQNTKERDRYLGGNYFILCNMYKCHFFYTNSANGNNVLNILCEYMLH